MLNQNVNQNSVLAAQVMTVASGTKSKTVPQGLDFKNFLIGKIGRLDTLSKEVVDDNSSLNLPEFGLYNISGDDKKKTGTLFALSVLTNQITSSYQVGMDIFNKSLDLLYDQPTKLIMGA